MGIINEQIPLEKNKIGFGLSHGVWNLFWLGFKPAIQFLAGVVLLPMNPELAGAYYAILLFWTVGFSICALLLEKQIVVLSQQQNVTVPSVVRSLFGGAFISGVVLSYVFSVIIFWLVGGEIWFVFTVVLIGSIAGICESFLWAILADKGRFLALAIVRVASVSFFGALLLWAILSNDAQLFAVPLGVECAFLCLGFVYLCGREIIQSPKTSLLLKKILGFWIFKVISYLNLYLDSWWTLRALSEPLLASLRIGSTPRIVFMLLMNSFAQPILFRITSQSWKSHKHSAYLKIRFINHLIFAFNCSLGCLTIIAYLMFPKILNSYYEALQVTWILCCAFGAFIWIGYLGWAIIVNYGAIKIPLSLTIFSLCVRSLLFLGLNAIGFLSIVTIVITSEFITFFNSVIIWNKILTLKIWELDKADKIIVIERFVLSSIAFTSLIGLKFSKVSLWMTLLILGFMTARSLMLARECSRANVQVPS